MNKKELDAIAPAAAKDIKTEDELNKFHQMLTKITVEATLNAELDEHLGTVKNEHSESENNPRYYRLRMANSNWIPRVTKSVALSPG